MDSLDSAIRGLLLKGRHVNRMMDNEKAISEAKKREEVEQLKKQLVSVTMDSTMMNSEAPPPQRTIYNKQLKAAESIDFDIPSLTYETSDNGDDESIRYTSTSLTIPTKTCPTECSKRTTTISSSEFSQQTFKKVRRTGGTLVLENQYIVDRDGSSESLPMRIYIKQRREDGSLDLFLVFYDETGQQVMDVALRCVNKTIRDVEFCGNEAKLD
uniref:Uncharacterized protein n=1 Tax=Caenorhabditis tropicalis TaxID=1561998 RepID=A0A1I7V0T8_9PELO